MAYVTTDMAMSLDGFSAGHDQTLERPFGTGEVGILTAWMLQDAEENAAERAAIAGADAYIMGRNMFGPDRGAFDPEWEGWWGQEPPYRAPVFVLSHHEREPLELRGTTFTFVTEGPDEALRLAREAAGDGRIDIAGGASTVNQYLRSGHIDEIRVHITPVILGAGTRLFEGLNDVVLEQIDGRIASSVAHLRYRVVRPQAPLTP